MAAAARDEVEELKALQEAVVQPRMRLDATPDVEFAHAKLVRAAAGRRRRLGDVFDTIRRAGPPRRSEEHTSELQSLMRISYAVFCLKKQKQATSTNTLPQHHCQSDNTTNTDLNHTH